MNLIEKLSQLSYLAWWSFQTQILRRQKPLQSVIFIADRCNLRCRHCTVYRETNPRSKTFAQISAEMEWCYEQGSRFIDFEGGEVTIWRDGDKRINDILDEAKRIGFFSCTITTNGQLPFKGTHADSVWVSMDGIGPFHDAIRGEGTFSRLEQNIAASGVKALSVNMVVNCENYTCVPDALEYVRNNPHIQSISFNFHTPFPGSEHLTLDWEKRREVIDTIIDYKRRGYPIMNTVSGLRNMRMVDGKLNEEHRPPFKRRCWVTNFIFSDGTRQPMCMGYMHGVCDRCGFCMGGEMSALFSFKPDTIAAGMKLRIKDSCSQS